MNDTCVHFRVSTQTMAPLHVATLTVQRELPKYEHLVSLPYLCTKNEIMAPLHVATLTVQIELPKYEHLGYLCTNI